MFVMMTAAGLINWIIPFWSVIITPSWIAFKAISAKDKWFIGFS